MKKSISKPLKSVKGLFPSKDEKKVKELQKELKELKIKYGKLESEIKKSQKKEKISATRPEKLIAALNSANLAVQKVHTKKEIFKALAGELKKLDIDSMVLVAGVDMKYLKFEFYSYNSKLLNIAEKSAKMTVGELKLSIEGIKEYKEVMLERKSIMILNSIDFVRRVLPDKLKFMALQLTKLFNISRFILTPLIIEGKVAGIFSVQSDNLVESDIPEVTMFAHQLAGAWFKSELLEKAEREIEERKIIEKELRNSEERFHKAFELSPYVIGITDLESGKYIDVNDNFEILTGYKKEEAIGKTASQFRLYKDASVMEKIYETLKVKNSLRNLQTEIVTKSGEIRIANGSAEIIILNGRKCVLGMVEDITEKKIAEEKLKESIRKTETLINNLPGAVFRCLNDREYTMEYISDGIQSITGYLPSDFIYNKVRSFNSIIVTENRDSVWEEIQKGLHEHQPYTLEYRIRTASGKIKWIWERGVGIYEKGYLAAIEGYLTDITEKRKAEEENMLLARTVRSAKDAISITDMGNILIYVNDAFLETYGYDEEDLIGKHIRIISPGITESMTEVIKTGTLNGGWHGELINERKDGTNFPVELWTSVVRDVNGNEIAAVGVARDITERKKAELVVKEAHEKLVEAQRVAKIGSWEDYLPSGELTWSDEMYSIFELEKKESINLKEVISVFPTEELEKFSKAVSDAVSGNKPYSMDYRIVMPDSRVKFIHDEGVVIRDSTGEAIRMFGTTQDITERKLAEEELKENQERFRLFFSQSLDGYYYTQMDEPVFWNDTTDKESVLDYAFTNQRIVEINDAMLNQYETPRESLIGKPVSIFFKHDSEYGRKMRRKLFDEGRLHVETSERKFDGTEIWIEGDYVCLYDEEKRITGTFGIQRDITVRKNSERLLIEAKEKAEEMSRVKSSFLANMSHEVRTPLVAILGFSEVLSEIVENPEMKNYVDMIHAGGERLLDTLNLILDLSVIESQKVNIVLMPVDIVKESADIVNLFRKFADKKNLSLQAESEFEKLYINTDEKILRQILNNLVNNALKYTENGSVTLSIEREIKNGKIYAAVRVADTGIGIPEDKRELIWDEFRQVSEGLNRTFEGAGLGLSITKKFVQKLGGEICLEKSELDIGSVFKVLFPVDDMIFESAILRKDNEVNKKILTEIDNCKELPSLLYIDDDTVSLDIVSAFTKDRYLVDTALTGTEGIEKSRSKSYDAVLMDINLGKEMNGIQATARLRELEEYKNTPIVAVTAYAMVGDKENFINCGCSHYISKPFNKKDLLELLEVVTKNK